MLGDFFKGGGGVGVVSVIFYLLFMKKIFTFTWTPSEKWASPVFTETDIHLTSSHMEIYYWKWGIRGNMEVIHD